MIQKHSQSKGGVAGALGVALAAALMVVATAGTPALAVDKRVKLKNSTDATLVSFQSKRAGGGSWTANILRGNTLAPGRSATVNFGADGSSCLYDVRAEFSNNAVQTVSNVDVCRIGEVNFTE